MEVYIFTGALLFVLNLIFGFVYATLKGVSGWS